MVAAVYIDRKDAALGYRDGALELRVPDAGPRRIPLRGMERLIIRGAATCTSGLLAQLWERRISVLFLSGRRSEPGARFHGGVHNDAGIRVAQVLACADARTRCQLARMLVLAKLHRQRRVLETLAHSCPGGARKAASGLRATKTAQEQIVQQSGPGLDWLRGMEGAAAAGYFSSYKAFFAPSLGFEARKRRPPPDPVNAVLSLGYTLAVFEAGRAAALAGLDTAIGALHGLGHGRPALSLDLVEPLRPLVDRFTQGLFARRTLTARHFKATPEGGMLLAKAGRQHFYTAWEAQAAPLRRLARQHARFAVHWLRAQKDIWPGEAP